MNDHPTTDALAPPATPVPSEADIRDPMLVMARASAQRTRRTLMLVQVFSLMVAALVFNSMAGNWTDARLTLLRTADRVLQAGVDSSAAQRISNTYDALGADTLFETTHLDSLGQVKRAERRRAWGTAVRAYLPHDPWSAMDSSRVAAAIGVIRTRSWDTIDVAKEIALLTERRVGSLLTIGVPLTGVQIDVNGLGIFAGLGLSILYLWLALGYRRERANVQLLEEKQRWDVLEWIRMESLFAPAARLQPWQFLRFFRHALMTIRIPEAVIMPAEAVARFLDRVFAWLERQTAYVAIAAPLAVVGWQLFVDSCTRPSGNASSPMLTSISFNLTIAAFVLDVLLALWCCLEFNELRNKFQGDSLG